MIPFHHHEIRHRLKFHDTLGMVSSMACSSVYAYKEYSYLMDDAESSRVGLVLRSREYN
jgi:hypothetical protein